MKPSQAARNIPTLDGWRALAILLVLGHHGAASVAGASQAAYWASNPGRFGTMGVAVFFGLSGLLICKLLLQEFDRTGTLSFRSFYVRRAFRILPPAGVFLLAAAALHLIRSRTELWACLAFVRNYVPESLAGTYTAHLWSLSVEEHFYLLWPGILYLLLSGSRPLRKTLALALSLGLWRALDSHLHLLARWAPLLDTPWRSDYRLDGLLWGCAAAFLLHRARTRAALIRRCSLPCLAALAGCFCLIQVVPVPLGAIWTALLIPAMMLATATHPEWRVSRILDAPPIRWIGRISYSLYLWQQLFLVPSWEIRPLPLIQQWPGNGIALLACTLVSYYGVEIPCIRLARGLVTNRLRRQPLAVGTASAAHPVCT